MATMMKTGLYSQMKEWAWNAERFGVSPGKLPARLFPVKSKIFTTSIPKAGTHLLERALCLHPSLYRKIIPTLHADIHLKYGGFDNLVKKMRGGQILVSHLPPMDDLLDALGNHDISVIFMIRDLRDVAISYVFFALRYHNHVQHSTFMNQKNLKDQIKLAITGSKDLGVRSIRTFADSLLPWLNFEALVVRFEDMIGERGYGSHETQADTIDRIYKYIGLPISPLRKQWIVDHVFSDASPTYREGEVRGWRKYFDEELIDLFKEIAGPLLVEYGYETNDEW